MIGNVDGAADGVAEVVLFVRSFLGSGVSTFFPRFGVEEFVAEVFEGAAVEGAGAGLGFDFDGAGTVAAVLGAVIGSEDFEFSDGFRIWINIERGVGAIVHVVAAVEFPVVVLGAAAVHGVGDVAVDADFCVILSGLADNARGEIDELRKVAAVEDEIVDLLAGDGAGEIGRGCFHLGYAFAGDDDFLGDGADVQGDVNASLFTDGENDFLGGKFLESFCGDGHVIRIARETGDDVRAITIGNGGAGKATRQILECDFGAGDGGSGFVDDGTTDVAGVLGMRKKREAKYRKEDEKSRPPSDAGINRARVRCFHDTTSRKIELLIEPDRRQEGGEMMAQKNRYALLTTGHPCHSTETHPKEPIKTS